MSKTSSALTDLTLEEQQAWGDTFAGGRSLTLTPEEMTAVMGSSDERLRDLQRRIAAAVAPQQAVRDRDIVALARRQCVAEGEVEIDDATAVSEGDDNGAFVKAWVWVEFAGTPLDKDGEQLLTAQLCEAITRFVDRFEPVPQQAGGRMPSRQLNAGALRALEAIQKEMSTLSLEGHVHDRDVVSFPELRELLKSATVDDRGQVYMDVAALHGLREWVRSELGESQPEQDAQNDQMRRDDAPRG